MKSDSQADPPSGNPSPADGRLDEGRKYWKAAIAHLAPEKQEAAWEFYLDRLESSAAADTLGGVMLLLEAHLAFFDDFPARLANAAQHIESALGKVGRNPVAGSVTPAASAPTASAGKAGTARRRLPTWIVSVVSASGGALLLGLLALSYRHLLFDPAGQRHPANQDASLARSHVSSVEPWSDPATHRQRGCIVCFEHTAWSEQTVDGGAKVYVFSPVEQVRYDLEALRESARSPTPVPRQR